MTYPGSGGPWQPNDPNQPGGPGSGPFPQPGQPYPGQPGAPQGGYPPPQQQPYPTGPQPMQQPGMPYGQPAYGGQPPKKSRKGPIIGTLAAVLVVALGVGATLFFINKDGDDPAGQPDPTAAADQLVNNLSQGDVLGVLESLTPAEAELLTDFNTKTVEELQRLNVYKPDADPNKLQGAGVEASDLQYDDAAAEEVNDHVTITKLVGGKVTLRSNMAELPLTQEFIDAAFPGGLPQESTEETIDVAEFIQNENNGEPIRIATVKDGDDWYPSLFYSVADYALLESGKSWPSEPIPNNGADSPEAAVSEMVDAAINQDLRRVIELLPPDELGALHDAGPVLLESAPPPSPTGAVQVTNLETETGDAGTGGTKVMLSVVEVQVEGVPYRVAKEGDCYVAEGEGQSDTLCAEDIAAETAGMSSDPAVQQALTNLLSGLLKNTGVVTTEVDGKWYVSPIRSYLELGLDSMSELQPEDVFALLEAA